LLKPSDERLERLPKPELHVHLDGSVRPATLLDLAGRRGVVLPASDPDSLSRAMLATTATSLEDYLEPFRLTLAVMQDVEAIERIAFELVEDHAEEHVRYVEVRFCPGLCTREGLTAAEVLDAALAGLARAKRSTPIRTGVIICALRSLPPSASLEMVELAVAYAGRGVCAFDLAGAEAGYPVADHVQALRAAEAAGLPRIGHGTRLGEDPGLLREVRETGIVLEVCLTSNVQTRVATSYEAHPLRAFYDAGLRVALCTDNRLMSGVTLTREYEHARDALGFTWEELVDVARTGFAAAFVPPDERERLLARFTTEVGSSD
jgi:adenosine deaminase